MSMISHDTGQTQPVETRKGLDAKPHSSIRLQSCLTEIHFSENWLHRILAQASSHNLMRVSDPPCPMPGAASCQVMSHSVSSHQKDLNPQKERIWMVYNFSILQIGKEKKGSTSTFARVQGETSHRCHQFRSRHCETSGTARFASWRSSNSVWSVAQRSNFSKSAATSHAPNSGWTEIPRSNSARHLANSRAPNSGWILCRTWDVAIAKAASHPPLSRLWTWSGRHQNTLAKEQRNIKKCTKLANQETTGDFLRKPFTAWPLSSGWSSVPRSR